MTDNPSRWGNYMTADSRGVGMRKVPSERGCLVVSTQQSTRFKTCTSSASCPTRSPLSPLCSMRTISCRAPIDHAPGAGVIGEGHPAVGRDTHAPTGCGVHRVPVGVNARHDGVAQPVGGGAVGVVRSRYPCPRRSRRTPSHRRRTRPARCCFPARSWRWCRW